MNILNKVFNFVFKIKVVHSLSGRLRVNVPVIKNIPEEWQVEQEEVTHVFLELPGVKSVSFSYITGNALVLYDTTVTNEKEILNGIKRINMIVSRYGKELSKVTLPELRDAIKRITKIIREELRKEFGK